jgi:hypothetical protein
MTLPPFTQAEGSGLLNRQRSPSCDLCPAEPMVFNILLLVALMAPILLVAAGVLIHSADRAPID